MSMLRWPRVEREAPQQDESTLFEASLESKRAKLRRKTPKRKTPNAVKARGAHGALRAQLRKHSRAGVQRPTSNLDTCGEIMETACQQAVFRFICRFNGVRARRLQLQFAVTNRRSGCNAHGSTGADQG